MTADRAPRRLLVVVVVLAALLGGCAPTADGLLSGTTRSTPPTAAPGGVEVAGDAAPAVRVSSIQRVARRVTVRVRAMGCGRLGTASAVAVAPRLLVTNRHVVEGADVIEINYWDGTSARATLRSVAVADDLALVRVSLRLPAVARLADDDPEASTSVFVAGYPNGGRQTVRRGQVVEYARLREPTAASPVMRLSASIMPGNSGGAVLDPAGSLAGVIFGVETETGYGLAIPVSAVRQLLDEGGEAPAAQCP